MTEAEPPDRAWLWKDHLGTKKICPGSTHPEASSYHNSSERFKKLPSVKSCRQVTLRFCVPPPQVLEHWEDTRNCNLMLLGIGGGQLSGGGALITGLQEAGPLRGQPGALTLFLWQLSLSLREGQEHAALHLSHLNTWPTGGAAGGPGLRNKPAGNRGAPRVGAGEDTGRQSKEITKPEPPAKQKRALAFLSLGARGSTLTEILEGLKFNLTETPETKIHQGFQHLLQTFNRPSNQLQLSVGNAIFMPEELELLDKFRKDAEAFYASEVLAINFKDSEAAIKLINEYVVHKAVLDVGEEGTEGAAITAVLVSPCGV
ncbi:SERPINA3-7 [Cervus elaphus hippelaphus]|uniref:SERPINA3-7 n=1 Tax=Cervus elaphus hippelaphus TaxID=46360 RepID=A0A212CRW4_CEREH|nr:SERPINA3-7 [Cervus elaphus hippelaphus]